MSTIICPHCQHSIDIDQAVSHQAEEKITAQFQAKIAALEKDRAEQEVLAKKQLIEQEQKMKRELWDKAQFEAQKKMQESSAKAQKELEDRLREQEQRTKVAETAELEMRKKQRELEQEKAQFQLKLEREVDERMKLEAERIDKQKSDQFSLREKELQKQIDDMKKLVEEATRKASTVSQQLQGEVLEIDIENQLRTAFAQDEVSEVKKGQLGADIIQTVKSSYGKTVGIIVWELKQTKDFQEKWISKLKEDTRSVGGSLSVLVTKKLPEDIAICAEREGVWITGIDFILPLAQLLRQTLLKVDLEKNVQSGKEVKAELLYQYINSSEFRGNIEGVVESFREMQDDLDREQRAMQTSWKKREKQILRLALHAAHIYGGMQGIVGNSLPSITGLDLEEPRTLYDLPSTTQP